MAIMDDKARWISGPAYDYGTNDAGYYQAHRNHVLSRTFVVDTHAEALLKIAVLGYARVLINGQPLGNIELLGDWTNYTKLVYVRSRPHSCRTSRGNVTRGSCSSTTCT